MYKADTGRGRKPKKDDIKQILCYACVEADHFSSSCTHDKKDLVCTYPPCKKMTDHVIKVCNKKRREEKKKKEEAKDKKL